MSALETATGTTNLHKSIEQLIAETIKQTQSTHEVEKQTLAKALTTALKEIEASQQSLNRAAEILRSALGTETAEPAVTKTAEPTAVIDEASAPTDISPQVEAGPSAAPTADRGAHELDVIAHGASITHATGLQTWLRGRSEVSNAQTREFVAGELRLHLGMSSGLDMAEFETWLKEHNANIVTTTEKVIEIRFGTEA